MIEMSSVKQMYCDSRGSVLIEAAFALPVLLMFGFGIIETSRAMWTQNTMQFAVEAAARCAAYDTTNCGTDAGIQTVAVSAAAGLDIASTSYIVTADTCGRKVSVSQTFDGGIPGIEAYTPTLTAWACYPT
jgi:Flp pilus assembly protein TadG